MIKVCIVIGSIMRIYAVDYLEYGERRSKKWDIGDGAW